MKKKSFLQENYKQISPPHPILSVQYKKKKKKKTATMRDFTIAVIPVSAVWSYPLG